MWQSGVFNIICNLQDELNVERTRQTSTDSKSVLICQEKRKYTVLSHFCIEATTLWWLWMCGIHGYKTGYPIMTL